MDVPSVIIGFVCGAGAVFIALPVLFAAMRSSQISRMERKDEIH